jgi:hypothetical protein
MAFRVYPDPPERPLSVAPGAGGVIRVDPANGQQTMLSATTSPFHGPHAIAVVPEIRP